MEDDIRMIDCTQIMEGPESQASWSILHVMRSHKKAFEKDRNTMEVCYFICCFVF